MKLDGYKKMVNDGQELNEDQKVRKLWKTAVFLEITSSLFLESLVIAVLLSDYA